MPPIGHIGHSRDLNILYHNVAYCASIEALWCQLTKGWDEKKNHHRDCAATRHHEMCTTVRASAMRRRAWRRMDVVHIIAS